MEEATMGRAKQRIPGDVTLETARHLLMAAVQKGVTEVEVGIYEFDDPGLSLNVLTALPDVRGRKLVCSLDWYKGNTWAKHGYAVRKRRIRIPIEGSFDGTFSEQSALLGPDEDVCEAREVVAFLVVSALATDEYLLSNYYVRTADKDSIGYRVYVGDFDRDGLYIHSRRWDDGRHPDIGLASSRKS